MSETPIVLPEPQDRMPLTLVAPPHPALVASETLLHQWDFRAQRRSGPGGQHRNKTSSGVFLHHQPTGVGSEATERRSQADNRSVAIHRLRLRLAVQLRTDTFQPPMEADDVADDAASTESELAVEIRARYRGRRLRVSTNHPSHPAVLALLLDDLWLAGGQPSWVSKQWKTSTSSLIALVKSHPPAFALLNAIRQHHGRRHLK